MPLSPLQPLQIRSSTSLFSNWICTFVPLNKYSGLLDLQVPHPKIQPNWIETFLVFNFRKFQRVNLNLRFHLGYDLYNIDIEFATTTDITFTLYWVLKMIWSIGEDVHGWYKYYTILHKGLEHSWLWESHPHRYSWTTVCTNKMMTVLLCSGYKLLNAGWLRGNILDFHGLQIKMK